MPPTGLESACLVIFKDGGETRRRRLVVRAVLQSWPEHGYEGYDRESCDILIREKAERQLERESRGEGYGFMGITVAFVFLSAVGGAISFVAERILKLVFPENRGGFQDADFRQQMTQWAKRVDA